MNNQLKNILTCPEQKRKFNRQVFTLIASQYDRMTRVLSFGCDRMWKKALVDTLPNQSCATIIDFACGTGDLTEMLAKKYVAGLVLGIDLTRPMLLRAKMRQAGSDNRRWAMADMNHSPLKDECAHVVTGGYALRNAPELDAFLREIYRVMRPGGIASFLDFRRSSYSMVFRFQYWILWLWGGFWGLLINRKPSAYQYIAESLRHFPDHRSLEQVLSRVGFESIATRHFFFGMSAIVSFRKPTPNHSEITSAQRA